ncbi:MAG: hypothetical protein ACOCYQ_07730 [Alkalispirochaeta sp.]
MCRGRNRRTTRRRVSPGLPVLIVLILGACSEHEADDLPAYEPGSFEGHTLVAADLLGTTAPELAVIGSSTAKFFHADGDFLRSIELDDDSLVFGMTADVDGDGKQDLLFGSSGAPRPRIVGMNGSGTTVLESVVTDLTLTFREMIPAAFREDTVYAVATPTWPRSPRGIVAVDGVSGGIRWVSFIPAEPLGLHMYPDEDDVLSLFVSSATTGTGTFSWLGLERRGLAGKDATISTYRLTDSGEIEHTRELRFPAAAFGAPGEPLPVAGILHSIGYDHRGYLLALLQPNDSAAPGAPTVPREVLARVNLDDGVVHELFPPTRGRVIAAVRWDRPDASTDASDILALVEAEDRRSVIVLDEELAASGKLELPRSSESSYHRSSPDGSTLKVSGDIGLVLQGDTVTVFDRSLTVIHRDTCPGLRDALVFAHAGRRRLAVLTDSLQVLTIPR